VSDEDSDLIYLRAVLAHEAVVKIVTDHLLVEDTNPARVIWALSEMSGSPITTLMDISIALARHLGTVLEMAARESGEPQLMVIGLVRSIADRHLGRQIAEDIAGQAS
jgi:hypothetical protein